ncbi:MAG: hypothetical protein HQ470_03140 [Methylophilales bacterium]|jgi:hypothetical protein|nr:hypothetical protein [Pseudomonadota bacterium]NQW34785.1 hypothetical protein [Methylophilales bacterium]|tara:strand:+ start:593 stop:748 length:156 start_codon:yes stop_codon:yes gene_type:complete
MTINNSLTDGGLTPNINENIKERGDQIPVDTLKTKEKDLFYRSLEAFSDCV